MEKSPSEPVLTKRQGISAVWARRRRGLRMGTMKKKDHDTKFSLPAGEQKKYGGRRFTPGKKKDGQANLERRQDFSV